MNFNFGLNLLNHSSNQFLPKMLSLPSHEFLNFGYTPGNIGQILISLFIDNQNTLNSYSSNFLLKLSNSIIIHENGFGGTFCHLNEFFIKINSGLDSQSHPRNQYTLWQRAVFLTQRLLLNLMITNIMYSVANKMAQTVRHKDSVDSLGEHFINFSL